MKIVIAGYVRTPFHFANKGQLAGVRPDDLAAILLRHLAVGLDPLSIEDVLIGCAYPEGEQGNNLARIAALLAGLPESIGSATINRFCGSSMSAIHYAAGQIALGCGEAFLCGGVESMSRVPRGGFSFTPNSLLQKVYVSMGQTAENVAAKYGITRLDQEQFALESQQKAGRARSSNGEMVAIGLVETDGCLRPQTTLEGLAQLKPAFGGSVTAGTASPLTDGAAMVLVCSEPYARSNRLEILASIRSMAVAGCPPELMGMGPVPATRKALARAGLAISDIDIFEVNEAFASQALACIRELEIPVERCNLDGGAIAIGHPLGATGARITGKAASLLRREGGRFALATQCIGGGQGIATVLEAWR